MLTTFLSLLLGTLLFFSPSNLTTNNQDLLTLGVNALKQANYSQSLEYFKKSIELQQNLEPAYSNLCLINIYLADYFQAKQDCTEALQISPRNFSAYLNRGLANYRLKDYQSAIADYQQLLSLQPNNLLGYYNRGLSYAAMGEYKKAIADYNQALVNLTTPESLELENIYNDRGLSYLGLNNFKAAVADFERVIRLNPNFSWGYFNLGCACHQQGQYKKAINRFSEALKRDPTQGETYLNRGLILMELGYYQTAFLDLEKSAECFCKQGNLVAYKQTLNLIKQIKQNLSLSEGVVG